MSFSRLGFGFRVEILSYEYCVSTIPRIKESTKEGLGSCVLEILAISVSITAHVSPLHLQALIFSA